MRRVIFPLIAALACTGCLSVSLKNHTERQIHSLAKYREQATLECLAVVADNPANLPPFANLADGVTQIQDTLSLSATTLFARSASAFGFSQQAIQPLVSRSPKVQWNLAPVADYTQLEALRCACRWVVYGPDEACDECAGILSDPQTDLSPGPHFGVAARLEKLPHGWLHISKGHIPPVGDRCRAHFGDTWVWVLPEDMPYLNEFMLVLLDISTLNIGQANQNPTETPRVLVHLTVTQKTEDTPHIYDLSPASVSDYKLANDLQRMVKGKVLVFGLSAAEIQRLRLSLNAPFVLSEEDYVALVEQNLDPKPDRKEIARVVAELARQPQAFNLETYRGARSALLQAGIAEADVKTILAKMEDPSNPVRIVFGRRAEYLEHLKKLLPAMAAVTRERVADVAQFSASLYSVFNFSRVSGLADAGLNPEQIRLLRADRNLDLPFVGTPDQFVNKLLDVLGENRGNVALVSLLQKVAAAARTPIVFTYSKELSFEQERLLRPEYREYIRDMIQAAVPGKPVEISWEQWMVMTTPFHGARSNVRPDGSVTTPVTTPVRPATLRITPLPDLLGPPRPRMETLQELPGP